MNMDATACFSCPMSTDRYAVVPQTEGSRREGQTEASRRELKLLSILTVQLCITVIANNETTSFEFSKSAFSDRRRGALLTNVAENSEKSWSSVKAGERERWPLRQSRRSYSGLVRSAGSASVPSAFCVILARRPGSNRAASALVMPVHGAMIAFWSFRNWA